MTMKREHSLFSFALLLFGFALIFLGFFLLVPAEGRSEVFWLNLAVVCVVYLVFSVTELGILGVDLDPDKEISALGTRLFFMRGYAITAVLLIILGNVADLSFRYQLFFQLCTVSIVLGGYFFSGMTTGQEAAVREEQRANRQGIEEMTAVVRDIEWLLLGESLEGSPDRRRMEQVRDRIRYLSPLGTREAEETENQVIHTLGQIRSAVSGGSSPDRDLSALWTRCDELLRIRKNMYHP